MTCTCVVCGKFLDTKSNWEKIREEFREIIDQVDTYGEISLTEHEQVLYCNKVHVECFDELR